MRLPHIVSFESDTNATNYKSASIACPTGERVMSGGVAVTPESDRPRQDGPERALCSGDDNQGWSGAAAEVARTGRDRPGRHAGRRAGFVRMVAHRLRHLREAELNGGHIGRDQVLRTQQQGVEMKRRQRFDRRLPIALGVAGLAVGVLGFTPIGEASVHAVTAKIPSTARYALNAGAVGGVKVSRKPKAGYLFPLPANHHEFCRSPFSRTRSRSKDRRATPARPVLSGRRATPVPPGRKGAPARRARGARRARVGQPATRVLPGRPARGSGIPTSSASRPIRTATTTSPRRSRARPASGRSAAAPRSRRRAAAARSS